MVGLATVALSCSNSKQLSAIFFIWWPAGIPRLTKLGNFTTKDRKKTTNKTKRTSRCKVNVANQQDYLNFFKYQYMYNNCRKFLFHYFILSIIFHLKKKMCKNILINFYNNCCLPLLTMPLHRFNTIN